MVLLEVLEWLFDLHVACKQTLKFTRHVRCDRRRIVRVRADWPQVLHKDDLGETNESACRGDVTMETYILDILPIMAH